MEFNIGDKVRFLNEVGEGEITKILPKGLVMICDSDGFEYQMLARELILIKAAKNVNKTQEKFIPNSECSVKEEKIIVKNIKQAEEDDDAWKKEDTTNIFVAFVKKEKENNSFLEVFLINDSNFSLFYNIITKSNGYQPLEHDILELNSKLKLTEFSLEQINTTKEFILQLTFFGHRYQHYRPQIEKTIKIVPLEIWQDFRYTENDFFNENAYIIDIVKEDFKLNNIKKDNQKEFEDKLKVIVEKDNLLPSEDKSKRFVPRKQKETVEVDLHITSLVESTVGLSNAEMLDIQMKTYHKALTDALLNKNIEKIIFIHGIGTGILKNMLRASIENQYKLQYEDASFREYGFGATMVIF